MVNWRLTTSTTEATHFEDAVEHDGVFLTTQESQRILFGYCNNSESTLAISSCNIVVHGPIACSKLIVNNVALTLDSGHLAASTAILDTTLPPSKLTEPVPLVLGGTGNAGLPKHEILFTGDNHLESHPSLIWMDDHLFSLCNMSAYHDIRSNLSLGFIPNVEERIKELQAGTALFDSSVTSNVISDSNILSRHFVDGCVLERHIQGPLSVAVGGTGMSTLPRGNVMFGNTSTSIGTDNSFSYDSSLHTLNVDRINIIDSLFVHDVGNFKSSFSNLVNASSISNLAILNRHIGNGAVTENKISGPLTVAIGGTGLASVTAGRIPYGNTATGLTTNTGLSFTTATQMLAAQNVNVPGTLSINGIGNMMTEFSNLVNGNSISNVAIINRHIANGAVTENKLSGPLTVAIGGTGLTSVTAGHIPYGNTATGLTTNTGLSFTTATQMLAAQNVNVPGTLSINGIGNMMTEFSNLVNGNSISNVAIVNRHIANGAVTENKLSGPLTVAIGGTGLTSVTAGRILYGNTATGLTTNTGLAFTTANQLLTAQNVNVPGTLSINGIGNMVTEFSNVVNGNSISNVAIVNRHIANGAVTENKLSGPLTVAIGGTGLASVAAGHIPYGNTATGLTTNTGLAFTTATQLLTVQNANVPGNLTVAGVGNMMTEFSNLVNGNSISNLGILNRHIDNGAVTENKLSGPLSVAIGGTGLNSVAVGMIPYGNTPTGLTTNAGLSFTTATQLLTAQNVTVPGDATIGGIGNIKTGFSNIINGVSLSNRSIINRHLGDSCILARNISNASIDSSKISGLLSVSVGGTGKTTHSTDCLLIGSGTSAIATSSDLTYSASNFLLTASNITARNRVHAVTDVLLGAPQGTRYRHFIDSSGNLVINKIDSSNNETLYVNFKDVVNVLASVTVYAPA